MCATLESDIIWDMAARKQVNPLVEARVLIQSARRCCLCFHLNHDFSEKEGQIGHLDHDPANGDEDNLAFLCLLTIVCTIPERVSTRTTKLTK